MTNPPVPHRSILGCPTRIALPTAAIVLLAVITTSAGPIDPPPGPITPTYKTLTEVEPRTAINLTNTPGDADSLFKITQRGSYYLTGNITGVVGKHGIEIAASGVTLDLMGFDLSGVPTSLDGVSATVFNLTNITIRNGSVRNWGGDGVDLGPNFAFNSAVIDLRAHNNTGNGILTGLGCTISNCTASFNTGNGISTSFGCTISNCTASFNTANGISTNDGCTITGCTAFNNTGNGISTFSGSTISNCTAYQNTGSGISTNSGSTITGCSAYQNTSNGISPGFGCTISNCTVTQNTGNGILTGFGCTISNCTAQANRLNGIRITSNCLVLANKCGENGNGGDGAGIHVTGTDNHIEGNTCAANDRGIDVDSPGNIIIKNTCSGNTINWTIVANNVVGPILDRTAPASAAISGNSAPSSLGSTDPNANFTY